jgi:hypothetical protein
MMQSWSRRRVSIGTTGRSDGCLAQLACVVMLLNYLCHDDGLRNDNETI